MFSFTNHWITWRSGKKLGICIIGGWRGQWHAGVGYSWCYHCQYSYEEIERLHYFLFSVRYFVLNRFIFFFSFVVDTLLVLFIFIATCGTVRAFQDFPVKHTAASDHLLDYTTANWTWSFYNDITFSHTCLGHKNHIIKFCALIWTSSVCECRECLQMQRKLLCSGDALNSEGTY